MSIQLWNAQHKKDTTLLEWVQRRATKILQKLEHLFCEDKLRELGVVQPRDEKAGEGTAAFSLRKGSP